MAVSSQLPVSDPDAVTASNGDYRNRLLSTLRSLRALVPRGRGSLAQDTVAYVQHLKDGIQSIQSEIHHKLLSSPSHTPVFATMPITSPQQQKVVVEMKDSGVEIQVECEKKPGLALALSKAIDGFNLTIIQARMTCQLRISFFVLCEKTMEGEIVDPEQLKKILQQTVSSYTACACGCSNTTQGK